MPKEGYSSITVNDEIMKKLRKIAEKHDESIPETISRLLKNCKEV